MRFRLIFIILLGIQKTYAQSPDHLEPSSLFGIDKLEHFKFDSLPSYNESFPEGYRPYHDLDIESKVQRIRHHVLTSISDYTKCIYWNSTTNEAFILNSKEEGYELVYFHVGDDAKNPNAIESIIIEQSIDDELGKAIDQLFLLEISRIREVDYTGISMCDGFPPKFLSYHKSSGKFVTGNSTQIYGPRMTELMKTCYTIVRSSRKMNVPEKKNRLLKQINQYLEEYG